MNNCVNDKRRVFSTIVGVAGCTALVVTAITLNDDVLTSFDKQYENVYGFTAYEYVDTGVDGAMEEAVKAAGELGVAACAPAFSQVFEMKLPTGENTGLFLVVPRDEASFSQVYHVNVREGAPFDPTAEGLWISEAYASHMGAKVGDTVTIRGADSTDVQVPILGFYEYYLTSYEAVMGPAAYASAFDTDYEANALLVDPGDVSFEDLSEALSGLDGHIEIVDEKAVEGENFDSFADVSRTVVLVYLVLAVLMATVVLLNLFVMFIEEKKRELIVLRINGFSVGEAKKYIYNDTIFLTLLGIAAGLALGIVMGTVTVGSVEPDTASLFKGIDPRAVIAGIGSSAVLATVMSIISLRRIPAFSLTDIDKV
jgi:putative ABC transport system permease protein